MSALKDLINQIDNEDLRCRVQREVDRLMGLKKFGLVFEDHLPESTQLPEVPVRVGSRVARRTASPSDAMAVTAIDGDEATCTIIATGEQAAVPLDDLVAVAQLGEPIYPYLSVVDSVCNAPDHDLWHALVEADNYHALQLLAYLLPRKVNCIYIDPPYNTGARDWKYNNDYVDSSDQYRHSKWLSMIKRRLELARLLLNPEESVLIVTIDEKEYLHLGCLLEEMFPEANIQMVSTVIKAGGVSRGSEFNRTNEFVYFITFGEMKPCPLELSEHWLGGVKSTTKKDIRWRELRRTSSHNLRSERPHSFFPIFVYEDGSRIHSVGEPFYGDDYLTAVVPPDGTKAIWPLFPDGREGCWQVSRDNILKMRDKGYIKMGGFTRNGMSISYISDGEQRKVESGVYRVIGKRPDGSIITDSSDYVPSYVPGTIWQLATHDATEFGTKLLSKIIGPGRFTYPKSLYAVHDAIRFFVADKPDAIIVDFFAGSGTTLHAVNLLNAEDGGRRRCILVTNNEVSDDEARTLAAQGHKPGDEQWERLGIARYVTWPRTRCSILGVDVNGKPLDGNYMLAGSDEAPQARSVKQIAIDPRSMGNDRRFKQQIIALLDGKIPQSAVTDHTRYLVGDDWEQAVLFDTDAIDDFIDELSENQSARQIFVFTTRTATFNAIKAGIAATVPPLTRRAPRTRPMSDGFAANAIYFKLGFLDKNAVALGRQFAELLPLLWMKCGAHGPCPTLEAGAVPDVLVLPRNRFAILNRESAYMRLGEQLTDTGGIDTVFIVTDSEPAFRRLQGLLPPVRCIQLYRDYLDNFRINTAK